MKRKLLKPIHECRCNGRLQTKRFTDLTHTGSVVELEHLKIKTRLTNEKFASVKGECDKLFFAWYIVYYESIKRELKQTKRFYTHGYGGIFFF